jgi:plasmid stabilization system protein ParE
MADVRFGRLAKRQLDAIGERRREQAGALSSDRLRDAFHRFFLMLGAFPRVSTIIYRTAEHEIRQFPVEGFVLRFRVALEGDVVIIDIRHGGMRSPPVDVLDQQAEDVADDQV